MNIDPLRDAIATLQAVMARWPAPAKPAAAPERKAA